MKKRSRSGAISAKLRLPRQASRTRSTAPTSVRSSGRAEGGSNSTASTRMGHRVTGVHVRKRQPTPSSAVACRAV
ncbi:MAG: hypothetical protein NVV74_21005 [Magnetospirillum sp.]|nr:hypothetical protein [Magnetospirillum sp.]